jgi:hypothetical protein
MKKCCEFAALERLCEAFDMCRIEIGVSLAARISPPRCMNSDRAHERAEHELPGNHPQVSVRFVNPASKTRAPSSR